MSKTNENLKEAFAGESQANQKYLAFAKEAEKAGFSNIAKLFRTTAQAESIHAEGHLAALGGVGSTADNLQAAIGGETFEHTEMYPPMLDQAKLIIIRLKRCLLLRSKLNVSTLHSINKHWKRFGAVRI